MRALFSAIVCGLALSACDNTQVVPGKAATIEVAVRAARAPDALGAADPVGSFQVTLRSETPAQEVKADVAFSKGGGPVSLARPFENVKATSAAQLTLWGVTLSGARHSVGRAATFELPQEGTVNVNLFLGAAGKFSAAPHALLERTGGASVSLSNGLVLSVGGKSGGAFVAPSLYDHGNGGVVTVGGDLPQVTEPAVVALDQGRALVAGGYDASGMPVDSVWLLNGASFTRQTAVLPAKVGGASAVYFPSKQKVVVVGGFAAGASPRTAVSTLAALSVSGSQVAVETSGTMIQARANASATLLSGFALEQALIAGGVGAEGGAALSSGEVLALDAAGKPVTSLTARGTATSSSANLVPGRTQHTAVAMGGGLVLLYGGSDGTAPLADPSPMIFTPLMSDPGGFLPVARPSNPARAGPRAGAQAALLPDGAVLLSGGVGQRPGDDAAVLFTPNPGQDTASTSLFQGTWVPTSPGAARSFGAAAVLPDRAVLFAGGGMDGGAAPAEVYVPCADAVAPCPF